MSWWKKLFNPDVETCMCGQPIEESKALIIIEHLDDEGKKVESEAKLCKTCADEFEKYQVYMGGEEDKIDPLEWPSEDEFGS